MQKNSQKKICIRDNKNNYIFNSDMFKIFIIWEQGSNIWQKYFYLCSPQETKQILKKSPTKKIKQKGASARNEELGSRECAEICNGESKKFIILSIKPIIFLNLLVHFSIFLISFLDFKLATWSCIKFVSQEEIVTDHGFSCFYVISCLPEYYTFQSSGTHHHERKRLLVKHTSRKSERCLSPAHTWVPDIQRHRKKNQLFHSVYAKTRTATKCPT